MGNISLTKFNPMFGSIRIEGTEQEPLFCAADVCKALGYAKPQNAVAQHVDEADALKQGIGVVTGKKSDGTDSIQNVNMTFVNESGLYALIFGSKLPQAKDFKRWVTSEVLPSIRREGGYIAEKENETEEDLLARALLVAQATLKRREERIKQLAADNERKDDEIVTLNGAVAEMMPKVTYVDMILASKETVTTTQIAQDYGLSAKTFNILLRNFGIQHKIGGQWILYAKHLPKGYVQSDTIQITHGDGTTGSVMHTKWTQKGRLFLYEELKRNGVLPLIEKREGA